MSYILELPEALHESRLHSNRGSKYGLALPSFPLVLYFYQITQPRFPACSIPSSGAVLVRDFHKSTEPVVSTARFYGMTSTCSDNALPRTGGERGGQFPRAYHEAPSMFLQEEPI